MASKPVSSNYANLLMGSDFASDNMGHNLGVAMNSKMPIESSAEDGGTQSLGSVDSGDLDRSIDSRELA